MRPSVGIMQGRLTDRSGPPVQVFPTRTWRDEFRRAGEIGFDFIEWLVEDDSWDSNPLLSAEGRAEIADVVAATGVRADSVCAHCFAEKELFSRGGADRLDALSASASAAGLRRIVLPLMERSSVRNRRDVVPILASAGAAARDRGVTICLETDLGSKEVATLLEETRSPGLAACVDAGNATSLGFDAVAELRTLLPRAAEVHLKDRMKTGEGRLLGEGETPLDGFIAELVRAGYSGPVVLETPAGANAAETGRRHLAFVLDRLTKKSSR